MAEEEGTEQPAPQLELEPAAAEAAPYGYMRDPVSGKTRPRKRAGRSGVTAAAQPSAEPHAGASPSLAELQAAAAAEGEVAREEDRAPGTIQRRGRPRGRRARAGSTEISAPPFRAGPIASGMNKLYARIGKVVRAMDGDIGRAIIAITRKESPDDVTVGEAWEELAKSNPRIRLFLLRMIEGGAWSQLFMAHLPIAAAIVMKEGVRSRLPMGRFLANLATPDDDDEDQAEETASGGNGLMGLLSSLEPGDMAQMTGLFNGIMQQAANNVPRSANGAVRVPVAEGDEQAAGP